MIKKLKIENFRSHIKYSLDLDKTTVLIGKNGIGKTNILEAVTLISFGRSFREDDRKRLINLDKSYARVTLDEYEMFMQRSPRLLTVIKHRGVNKRISQVVGQLPSVVFSPETLDIITGEPSERRRFLDIAISQTDRGYLKNLNAYTKVRRQRNKLLERIQEGLAGQEELSYWDEQLADLGDKISAKRLEAIDQFNQKLSDYYQTISGDTNSLLQIEYQMKSGGGLAAKLLEHRPTEIRQKSTIFGPHRDDMIFKLNNMDMAHYASRGETRSAILALKVAELDYIENERQKSPEVYDLEAHPLLLLDDVYSEFDAERRAHLAKLIANYQTLITTTDMEHLSGDIISRAKIVEIS